MHSLAYTHAGPQKSPKADLEQGLSLGAVFREPLGGWLNTKLAIPMK